MITSNFNPFVVGKYISDEYFCDREAETELIKKQLANGRNLTLIADRRLGKSGLIEHVYAQNDVKEHYHTIYVDLYSTKSLAELVQMFSNALYRSLKGRPATWTDKFFRIISSLRVGFKLDEISGSPTFDIGLGEITEPPLTLEQIFTFLDNIDKPCVVAFDEFQQIALYSEKNVEAVLRTHIQKSKNTQFIFSGSRKHLMSQMFLSPAKPFYQSTVNIGLEPIAKGKYVEFAHIMFSKGDKSVETAVVEDIYDKFRGVTWYVQLMMNELYALTERGATCNASQIAVALDNLISIQESFYKDILASLPLQQKKLLFAIAKNDVVRNLSSQTFIRRNALGSASSVQSALRGLRDKDLVTDIDGGVAVYDVFFSNFLRQQI